VKPGRAVVKKISRESTGYSWASAKSASGDVQDRMVALACRIFKRGGNVPGFQQRVISEEFLAAGASGQQIEHVLDADAKTPQAGPSATLGWIDGDTMGFAHVSFPRQGDGSKHSVILRCELLRASKDGPQAPLLHPSFEARRRGERLRMTAWITSRRRKFGRSERI
jgi:hypothetical protein